MRLDTTFAAPRVCGDRQATLTPSDTGGTLPLSPTAPVDKSQEFASLGVQMLVITGNSGNSAQTLSAMDMLAREVLPVFQ